MPDTTTATPQCEGRTGVTPGEFRLVPVGCDQTRGLRVLIDGAGTIHRYCGAAGHAESVALRFGAIRQLMASHAHDEAHDLTDHFDPTCRDCGRAMDQAQNA